MVRPCGNEQLDSALRNIMLEIFPWMCMKRSYLSGERVTFENAIQDSEYVTLHTKTRLIKDGNLGETGFPKGFKFLKLGL